MQLSRKHKRRILILLLLLILAMVLYMTLQNRQNWSFILPLRGKRVIAFGIVGMSSVVSTIVFQTITQNRILSPSIIGLDSMYLLFQTIILFFLGGGHTLVREERLNFLVSTLLMVGGSFGFYWLFFKKSPGQLFLLLMTGLVLGTFFQNVTTFLHVLMDPNEFDQIQQSMFVSFNDVSSDLLLITIVIAGLTLRWIFQQAPFLDVLHLGRDSAINLGIDVDRMNLKFFAAISILTAISTALVGPVTFLGFIGANVTYRIMGKFEHQLLFVGGSLLTVLMIVFGQMIVEHVFQLGITLSVALEFMGGLYFLYILVKERKELT